MFLPEETDTDASLADPAAMLVGVGQGGGGNVLMVAEEGTSTTARGNGHG